MCRHLQLEKWNDIYCTFPRVHQGWAPLVLWPVDCWIIETITPANHRSYIQEVYLKELFDLKHTIMRYNYETFGYLQHRF